VGVYNTETFQGSVPYSELEKAIFDLKERIEKSPGLPGGAGIVTIEPAGPGLKHIQFQIDYEGADGNPAQFLKSFYLHENSLYWEAFGS